MSVSMCFNFLELNKLYKENEYGDYVEETTFKFNIINSRKEYLLSFKDTY